MFCSVFLLTRRRRRCAASNNGNRSICAFGYGLVQRHTRVRDCSDVGGAYPYETRYGITRLLPVSQTESTIENDFTFDESCVLRSRLNNWTLFLEFQLQNDRRGRINRT